MIGDHIRALVGGEWRHAIDCGDGTVLHLAAGAGAAAARVRRSYRPEFVSGAEKVEVVVHRERVFPARQVVARAYSRASEPTLASMFESSAAFAAWCKAGHVEEREVVALSVPALVQPKAPAAAAPGKPVRALPRPAARRPAPKATARKSTPKKAAGRKPARPTRAARKAPRKPAGARARKPARRAASRPAARAPAKTRAAARRKGSKARGARR